MKKISTLLMFQIVTITNCFTSYFYASHLDDDYSPTVSRSLYDPNKRPISSTFKTRTGLKKSISHAQQPEIIFIENENINKPINHNNNSPNPKSIGSFEEIAHVKEYDYLIDQSKIRTLSINENKRLKNLETILEKEREKYLQLIKYFNAKKEKMKLAKNNAELELKMLIELEENAEALAKKDLHFFAKTDNSYEIQYLLSNGADIRKKNSTGEPALFTAIQNNSFRAVKTILDNDFYRKNPNGKKPIGISEIDIDGNTALHVAAESNCDKDIIDLILKSGFDPNAKNNFGDTPLTVAIHNDNLDMVKALVEYEVNINEANVNGYTPLHNALYFHNNMIAEHLLNSGAKVNVINKFGLTPLMIAIENHNLSMIKKLIESKANIELADTNNNTPLLLASSLGYDDIIDYLLRSGADKNAKNTSGQTYKDVMPKKTFNHFFGIKKN